MARQIDAAKQQLPPSQSACSASFLSRKIEPGPLALNFVHAMHCKNVLGKINSNDDNAHDFPLLVMLMKSRNSIMARLVPFATTQPQPRDEEVPFIR